MRKRDRGGYVSCPDCNRQRFVKQFVKAVGRCRSCSAKNTNRRSNSASKGGLVGGKVTASSGKLHNIAGRLAHTPEAERRRFETLKHRGKLWSSIPEQYLHEILCQHFGVGDVEHHVIHDGFRIDFYVKSIDTYIQCDGLYWHGLTAPYEALTGTPKAKYDRDRQCDAHFASHGLRLVRITDRELKEGCDVISKL